MRWMKHSPFIDNRGQALMMGVMAVSVSLMLCHVTLKFSRFIERKIMLQNGVDAALLSATHLLAEGLNQLSRLNQKLMRYHKLLALIQMGKLIPSPAGLTGMVLTEKIIKTRINLIAKQQDIIKMTYPLLAVKKAHVIAKQNNAPYVFLQPTLQTYAIQRSHSIQQLPGPYHLKKNFFQHSIWSIRGFAYRGSYRTRARTKLTGQNLMTATWG